METPPRTGSDFMTLPIFLTLLVILITLIAFIRERTKFENYDPRNG